MFVHRMWFGNTRHAQWVPVPRPGMTRTEEGSGSVEFDSDNGGLWIDDSEGTHVVYEMEYPIVDRGYEGIEAFRRFKSGSYGSDYLRFVDPMYQRDNLFSQPWSEPGNAEMRQWKTITDRTVQYVDTPYSTGNPYRYPLRAAVVSVRDQLIDEKPRNSNGSFTLLIPPGHSLWLGGAGELLTSDIQLRIESLASNGTVSGSQNLPLQLETFAPSLTTEVVGASAVRIFVNRTGATTADPTARITSLWAQVRPTGEAATIDRHLIGQGHSGLKMRGSSRVDTYVQQFGKKVGASLVLAEVEPWAPRV